LALLGEKQKEGYKGKEDAGKYGMALRRREDTGI